MAGRHADRHPDADRGARGRPMMSPMSPMSPMSAKGDDEALGKSIIQLTQQLVRTPSRGGVDPYEPVLEVIEGALNSLGLSAQVLADEAGSAVAIATDVPGAQPGPRYVIDACLDT